jgi:hypothetical protein
VFFLGLAFLTTLGRFAWVIDADESTTTSGVGRVSEDRVVEVVESATRLRFLLGVAIELMVTGLGIALEAKIWSISAMDSEWIWGPT